MFQRDSEYLEGRRVRESRVNRAIAARSATGRAMISAQWASAEFAALSRLWAAGLPVPYPVQILGTDFCRSSSANRTARPRRGWPRPGRLEPARQPVGPAGDCPVRAGRLGYAHGDLSAYNLLVHGSRLVMIDMPQIVDVIANPRGAEFLTRDSVNIARWFTARGLSAATPAPADLAACCSPKHACHSWRTRRLLTLRVTAEWAARRPQSTQFCTPPQLVVAARADAYRRDCARSR